MVDCARDLDEKVKDLFTDVIIEQREKSEVKPSKVPTVGSLHQHIFDKYDSPNIPEPQITNLSAKYTFGNTTMVIKFTEFNKPKGEKKLVTEITSNKDGYDCKVSFSKWVKAPEPNIEQLTMTASFYKHYIHLIDKFIDGLK